jgi:hypothetical protein
LRLRTPRVVPVNEGRPPEAENWWRDWGKSVAFLALGIVGVVAAMAIVLILLF